MTDIEFKQIVNLLAAVASATARIADAMEAHQANELDKIKTLPLNEFHTFDWATINARAIYSDADGVAAIAGEDGRIYKRRSNAKYGNDIWFSRGDGKNEDDGTPNYKTLVKFVDIKIEDVQPLGRSVATAAGRPAQTQGKPVEAPKAPPATVEPAEPVKAPVSAKYAPSAEERRAVSSLLDYAGLTAKADKNEIIRNADAIRAKFTAACEAATKRGMKCLDKPENLKQALEGIASMALACVEFDAAQPEMALN